MLIRMKQAMLLGFVSICSAHAGTITLIDTIPSGNLFLQPPVRTGGGFAGLANGFVAPVTADLLQVSVVVNYQDFAFMGITGRSPMILALLMDNNNSPGAPIETWTVPLDPMTTTLTIVTATSSGNPRLLAGQEYWLSEIPADPAHTAIGWGLASSGYPGIQLPIAFGSTEAGWGPTQLNLANEFRVSGTAIPEPSTLGLAAIVLLAAFGGFRASRRRRKHLSRSPIATRPPIDCASEKFDRRWIRQVPVAVADRESSLPMGNVFVHAQSVELCIRRKGHE